MRVLRALVAELVETLLDQLADQGRRQTCTRFPEPDRFDITRTPNPHLSFGYGPRFCTAAGLARIELHAVLTALPGRFPTLQLAVPFEELQLRTDVLIGGLAALPVRW